MFGFSKETWEEFSRLQLKLVKRVDELGEKSVDTIPTSDIDKVIEGQTPTGNTVLSLTGVSYFWAKIKDWATSTFRKTADLIQSNDIASLAITEAKIANGAVTEAKLASAVTNRISKVETDVSGIKVKTFPVGYRIYSKQSLTPQSTYGGTWSYDSTSHGFNGLYIYTKTAD